MGEKAKAVGKALRGKISDRIRRGDIPADAVKKVERVDPAPKASSVRHGSGQGLGKGAHRRRSGDGK